jgi:hypothetical protein
VYDIRFFYVLTYLPSESFFHKINFHSFLNLEHDLCSGFVSKASRSTDYDNDPLPYFHNPINNFGDVHSRLTLVLHAFIMLISACTPKLHLQCSARMLRKPVIDDMGKKPGFGRRPS